MRMPQQKARPRWYIDDGYARNPSQDDHHRQEEVGNVYLVVPSLPVEIGFDLSSCLECPRRSLHMKKSVTLKTSLQNVLYDIKMKL